MPNDTVIKLIQPGTFNDQLTAVLRKWGARPAGSGSRGRGRRRLIRQAVTKKWAIAHLANHASCVDESRGKFTAH